MLEHPDAQISTQAPTLRQPINFSTDTLHGTLSLDTHFDDHSEVNNKTTTLNVTDTQFKQDTPKSQLTKWPPTQLIAAKTIKTIHLSVWKTKQPKIPVPTALNINAWRSRLHSFTDNVIVDYLEFGWPVNYQRSQLPTTRIHNHPAATNNQVHV